MPHIAETLIRQRRWVVLGWALVTAALVPGALGVERALEAAARVPGSESESVDHGLASGFGSPYAQFAVLVVSEVPAPPESRRQVVDSLVKLVSRVQGGGVTRVRAWRDAGDTLFLADSGRTTFLLAGIDATRYAPGDVVDKLRAATRGFTGATLRWTGEAALNADMRQVSARDAAAAEHRVMPLAAVLLVVAFGTLVAALLPLVTGALTIVVALGAAALIATHWPLSIVLQTFVTMIGLGLGIDYALLVVSRFRELLAAGATSAEAAAQAARRAGHTIILSGASVGIGFCGLLAAPVSDLRSLAVGGVLVVSAAVLVATTLLPALLAEIGGRVNAGRLWSNGTTTGTEGGWRRWGAWIVRRPGLALLAGAIPLVVLAWAARRMVAPPDRGGVLVPVVPPPALRAEEAIELARALRRLDVASVTGVPGAASRVGGLPALRADYLATVSRGFPRAVALIVSATLIALAIGFRSILIPVKAVALNLLSVAAGFGAVVLVFQDGVGATLLGVTRLDQVFATVPTLVFCTVFGLSMDYEVFLVSRVAEARRGGLPERAAIVEGLARTGRVITSAALIMAVVFGAFIAADFVLIKMLGLALTVAVLADATLVRVVIGPALLALAGRWNWWPGDVR